MSEDNLTRDDFPKMWIQREQDDQRIRVYLPPWVAKMAGLAPNTIYQHLSEGESSKSYGTDLSEEDGDVIRLRSDRDRNVYITEQGLQKELGD